MEAPAAINVVAVCQHAGVWRGFFRSKPPPATGAYANLGPCVHKNAHSSSAERQEEVINRGFNVTRRRGQPRFEATNEQRRAVEILVGPGIPQAHIRRLVRDRWDRPISENTLRKYFKPEIARGPQKCPDGPFHREDDPGQSRRQPAPRQSPTPRSGALYRAVRACTHGLADHGRSGTASRCRASFIRSAKIDASL